MGRFLYLERFAFGCRISSPWGLPPRDDDCTARPGARADLVSVGLAPTGRRLHG
jgi:hypothetical protein